jgi:Zn-dependent peptidase ImmA (M78 family)
LENTHSGDVSDEIVTRLSRVLDFPERFFSVEPKEPFHRGSLLFRSKSTLTDSDAEHLAEFGMAVSEIFTILLEYASCPPVRLPELHTITEPAEAAAIVRQQFNLKQEEPISNLTRKGERAGITVIYLDFSTQLHNRLDAFSCWIGDYTERPLIVLRASASWERVRWSFAHELGHAVLHRKHRDGDIEDEANRFANELLAPSHILKDEWPASATIMSLLPLKEKWGLSLQALIQHGFKLNLIDESRRTSLFKQLSNRKWPDGIRWREREPGYNLRELESPRLLGKMIEVGFGVDARLDQVSDSVGYWPPLFLQQLFGDQLRRSGQGRRERLSPRDSKQATEDQDNRAQVVSFPGIQSKGSMEQGCGLRRVTPQDSDA